MSATLNKHTVLLVDDHAGFREMIREYLEIDPALCREAPDGLSAVEACRQKLPDLILMDIKMPEMDGITAVGKIITAHPEARILIVSQHDDIQTRRLAAEAGAAGLVSKNNLHLLLGQVEEILERN